MKTFYMLVDNKAQVGSGDFIPDGFIEYIVGEEPQELKEALETEQKANELKTKLAEAKTYLADTDYIVTKIAEAQALGENTEELLREYAVELEKRKEARAFVGTNLQGNYL